MKKIDFVKMGFRNLWRRKLRTILTITGVFIVTFSIVIMVSLGVGMTEGYKEQLEVVMSILTVILIVATFAIIRSNIKRICKSKIKNNE